MTSHKQVQYHSDDPPKNHKQIIIDTNLLREHAREVDAHKAEASVENIEIRTAVEEAISEIHQYALLRHGICSDSGGGCTVSCKQFIPYSGGLFNVIYQAYTDRRELKNGIISTTRR